MKKRLASLATLAAALMLSGAGSAVAYPSLKPGTFKPMFVVGPRHLVPSKNPSSKQLAQWNGSFTDLKGNKITFTMIGGNPMTSNGTSKIKIYIVPIKMIYGKSNGNMTFDPLTDKASKKRNVIDNILKSPIFSTGIDFAPQGGSCSPNCVDLGNTQYEDAFQRGTWWNNAVATNSNYHVIFDKPKVLAEQTITVSASQGQVVNNPTGPGQVGTFPYGTMDGMLQQYMKSLKQINPGVVPLFVVDNVYLTSGGCCIGGYHDALGPQPSGQTYSFSTYITTPGTFSQDVSAMTHELGEWMDDPFVDNYVDCEDNGLMEVGDPLERNSNYGAFPYKLNGFTYNLQSLVYIGYFGAPQTWSANDWLSFQDDKATVCPGQ